MTSDANFQADARAVIKWQIEIWNRLDKLKPRNMPNAAIPDQASNFNHQGNLMQDTLYNLDQTLQKQ